MVAVLSVVSFASLTSHDHAPSESQAIDDVQAVLPVRGDLQLLEGVSRSLGRGVIGRSLSARRAEHANGAPADSAPLSVRHLVGDPLEVEPYFPAKHHPSLPLTNRLSPTLTAPLLPRDVCSRVAFSTVFHLASAAARSLPPTALHLASP